MLEPVKVLVVLSTLFLLSAIYAVLLDRHPGWYLPDRSWATVVIGNVLIILALAALDLWGIPLRIGHVILANCAAGLPIVVWQFIQAARRNGERRTARRKE